jgi:plastocyanin
MTSRLSSIAIGALVALAVTFAWSDRASALQSPANSAIAQDFDFVPQMISVPVGSTVTWINNGAFEHSVTADDGSFDSGLFLPGEAVSLTFDTPGTYPYYCIPDGGPGGAGMSGVIVVE